MDTEQPESNRSDELLMSHRDAPPLVKVFHTQDLALLSVVKGLLDSAGLQYEVQGEHSLGMIPLSPASGFFKPSSLGVSLRVCPEDAEEVRELLAHPSAGWESD